MTKLITPPCKATGDYVTALINQPWARDGRHCWRLVAEVQRDLFNRTVPLFDVAPGRSERALLFATHQERRHWLNLGVPIHGAIALMRRHAAQPGNYSHAGVFLELDGGHVLHTDDPHGVVFDTLPELTLRGWVPSWFVPCTV